MLLKGEEEVVLTLSYDFLKSVLDTLTDHVVVIDRKGYIVFVNRQWKVFAEQNDCTVTRHWEGVNYLSVCDASARDGDDFGRKAVAGIRRVISGGQAAFYLEYPCHSDDEKRWFMMRVKPLTGGASSYFVISHQNITERKTAEEKVLKLSLSDGLTGLSNRRCFDTFLSEEWRRCTRLKMPLTLVLMDIDNFKTINDTYGHQVGDECLRMLSGILNDYAKRPGDLSARLGGDEFAIVFGNTPFEKAKKLLEELISSVRTLAVPDNRNNLFKITVSIGMATVYPEKKISEADLIKAADTQLYFAKGNGKNQVAFTNGIKQAPS